MGVTEVNCEGRGACWGNNWGGEKSWAWDAELVQLSAEFPIEMRLKFTCHSLCDVFCITVSFFANRKWYRKLVLCFQLFLIHARRRFLTTSAIESSINFLSMGRICIINLSLAPDHSHSGRARGRAQVKFCTTPSERHKHNSQRTIQYRNKTTARFWGT